MTTAMIGSQQLGEFFDATSKPDPMPPKDHTHGIQNPRQLKRWKEKQIGRWHKQMGEMPVFPPMLETNIPNRIGRNLLDEDGNLNLDAIKGIGAKGGANAAVNRRSALDARIRQLLEDPIIARNWGNQEKKEFIARRAGVTSKTVGTWFNRFPASLLLKQLEQERL